MKKLLRGLFEENNLQADREMYFQKNANGYSDENFFQGVLHQSHDAVIVHAGFLIVHASGKSPGRFGYGDLSFLTGRNILDFMDPAMHAGVKSRLAETEKTGKSTEYIETEILCSDGRSVPVEISSMPVSFRGSKSHLALVRVITPRKKIEQNLNAGRKQVFMLSPDIITITRVSDGLYIDVNEAFVTLMGYSRDEVIGRSSIDLGIWADMNERFRILGIIFKKGEVRDEVLSFRGRRGNIVTGEFSGRLIDIGGESCLLVVVRDITERIKAEKLIRENEEKFSRVFKLSPDSITISRIRDAVYLDVNETYTRLMGYTREETIGKSAIDMNIWFSMEDRTRVMNEITTNGIITNREILFRRKNGTTLVGNLSGRTIEIQDEPCILFVTRDDTESMKAREEIRANQERLKKAQEVGKVGCWEYDFKTKMMWGSEQALAIFGLDPLKSTLPADMIEDRIVEKVRIHRAMEDRVEKNASYDTEYAIIPYGSKEETIIMSVAELVRDGQGEPVKVIGVMQDVTERRKAERALRDSEERWQYALEGSGDGVWDWDVPQNRIYYSRRWKEMLGYGENEIGDCPDEWFGKIHPDDADSHRQWRRVLLEGIQDQLSCEYRMICRDESYKWILVRGKVMSRNSDGSPRRIVGTNTDIGKRKTSEQERIRLKDKLHQIEKYDTLGRLAGGIAHDFNNMLVPIIGYAELMLSAPDCEGQLSTRLEGILQAAEGAKGLTQQILAFSRKQILQLKVLDINAVIESIHKMIRRLIGEDITVSVSLAEDLVHVEADSSQIQQIIMNLVLNARDAMPDGGKLIIETCNVYVDNLFAKRNPDMCEGGYALLKVTDTGSGIPIEIRDRIFEPFFTTKGEGKGTGLGLATVYGIVKQHRGSIRVISGTGVGSCFLLYFPSAPCAYGDIEEGKLPAANYAGTESILVVEDSDTVRDLTRQILEYFGYSIYASTGWEETLNIIGDKEKIIDLVIMDVVMPGLNGFDLYKRISAVRPGIKVIFMSGYPENVVESNNVDRDNINFIRKPFSMRTLAEMVRRVLDVKTV